MIHYVGVHFEPSQRTLNRLLQLKDELLSALDEGDRLAMSFSQIFPINMDKDISRAYKETMFTLTDDGILLFHHSYPSENSMDACRKDLFDLLDEKGNGSAVCYFIDYNDQNEKLSMDMHMCLAYGFDFCHCD